LVDNPVPDLLVIFSLTFLISVLSQNYKPFFFAYIVILKIKAAAFFRMLVLVYQSTWPHIPEDCYTNIHCNGNLRSHRQRVLRRIFRPGREEAKVTVQVVYTVQPNIIRVTGMRGVRNTYGLFFIPLG
jgi:hypothetical protein